MSENSRVALVLFEGEVIVDGMCFEGNIADVLSFSTAVVLQDFDIFWAPKVPVDILVLDDRRQDAFSIQSVLKGISGDIERYKVSYDGGIRGIFIFRRPLNSHPYFSQRWRIQYSLPKRKVSIAPDINSIYVRTY